MTCHHLRHLEHELRERGIPESFRGRPWTHACREWVYFACQLDLESLRQRLELPACVVDHVHRGTHDGQEQGFVCREHEDAIMGLHPESSRGYPLVS